METDTWLKLAPALIGAFAAVVGILLRDLFFTQKIEVRRRRAVLVERKLEKVYSPLAFLIHSLIMGANGTVRDEIRQIIKAHAYLLSERTRSDMYAVTELPMSPSELAQIAERFSGEFDRLTDDYQKA